MRMKPNVLYVYSFTACPDYEDLARKLKKASFLIKLSHTPAGVIGTFSHKAKVQHNVAIKAQKLLDNIMLR